MAVDSRERDAQRRAQVEAEAQRNEAAGNTRMSFNRPAFELPGARHGAAQTKPHAPKAWARRDERLPGRGMHAERKEAEQRAAEKHVETVAEKLARVQAMASKAALERRAPDRKRQQLNQGRDDFRWRIDKETGEAEYVKYWDRNGVAFEER